MFTDYLEFYMGGFYVLDGRKFKGEKRQFEGHLGTVCLLVEGELLSGTKGARNEGKIWRLEGT